MHALVFLWPNGCSVSTWNKHTPFECKQKYQGVHLFVLGGPRQQDHDSMNVHTLSNPHARKKWNEKKAFD